MEKDEPISLPPLSAGDPPKRYIRTLARDMETLQKGGVPELSLFHKHVVQEEPLIEVLPANPPQVPPPAPQPPQPEAPLLVPIAEPTAPKREVPTPQERLIEPSPVAPAPVAPPPSVPPSPPKEKKEAEPKPPPLQTYSQDFRDRIKETHSSTAAVLAAEQDAVQREPAAPREKSSGTGALFVVGGIVLLVLGAVGVYFAYARYLAITAPVVLTSTPIAPIFVDETGEVEGIGITLQQAVKQAATNPLKTDAVRLLVLAPADSGKSIFEMLSLEDAPGILLRNIHAEGSMAGIVGAASGASPFFILAVEGYGTTFSGMLTWEPTIQKDLETLYPLYSEAATSSPTAVSAVAKSSFRDEVVSNHDVRVYRDAEGKSVMLYGYWNQETLVIARDPSAFAEILTRLATSRIKK